VDLPNRKRACRLSVRVCRRGDIIKMDHNEISCPLYCSADFVMTHGDRSTAAGEGGAKRRIHLLQTRFNDISKLVGIQEAAI
jgi:hypothetical protein